MTEFTYQSDLTGGSLMVRESRIIADLLLKQATPEEWVTAIKVENLLQKNSPATAKRNAQAICKRLEKLEPEFWRALRDGDDELATQVAFCAALERNLLLVEFMERVVKDAYIAHAEKLELYQWGEFLDDCAHKDAVIHDWKESSKKKMGQVAFRMLAEMGYINNTRRCKLQNVLVRAEVKAMLEDSYRLRIKECMEASSKGGR